MSNIGIKGNYNVHRIYDAGLDFPAAQTIEDDLRGNYFHTDQEAFNYFQDKYPEYETTIVPCKGTFPYEDHLHYSAWHIEFLKVTLRYKSDDSENDGTIILMKT